MLLHNLSVRPNIHQGRLVVDHVVSKCVVPKVGQKLQLLLLALPAILLAALLLAYLPALMQIALQIARLDFQLLLVFCFALRFQFHDGVLEDMLAVDLGHEAEMVEDLGGGRVTSILRKGKNMLLKEAEHSMEPRME